MIGRLSGVLGVGCAVLLAGAAAGQVEVSSERAQKSADNAPLRGPRVRASSPPGARGRLVEGQADRRERATPLRLYRAELKKMGSAEADDSIRLSGEQIEQIRGIASGFEQKMRAHMEQHRDELRELRAAAGLADEPMGRGNDQPRRARQRDRNSDQQPADTRRDRQRRPQRDDTAPMDDSMMPANKGTRPGPGGQARDRAKASPEMRAMRERMMEIRAAGPSERDAIKLIWVVLTPDQQSHLESRVKDAKSRMPDRAATQRGGRDAAAGKSRRGPRDGAEPSGQRRSRDGQQRRPNRRPAGDDRP